MDREWYHTLGVPGGEIAFLAGSYKEAVTKAKMAVGARIFQAKGQWDYSQSWATELSVRPASPELIGWIIRPIHEHDSPSKGVERYKVPGGWLYAFSRAMNIVFVPIEHARGLTVLEDVED